MTDGSAIEVTLVGRVHVRPRMTELCLWSHVPRYDVHSLPRNWGRRVRRA